MKEKGYKGKAGRADPGSSAVCRRLVGADGTERVRVGLDIIIRARLAGCSIGTHALLRDGLHIGDGCSELHLWNVLLNPFSVGCNADVDTRSIGGPARVPPTHHPGQQPSIANAAGQGSSGVTLEKWRALGRDNVNGGM